MKNASLVIMGVVLLVGFIVGQSAMFTVHQSEQVLVLQFGNPIRVIREPGLNFKVPFVQDVTRYDARILDLDPPVQEVLLADQKRVNVDSFARYKIIDPLEFRKKAGTDANFRQVFGGRLNSAIRNEIGKILLGDMLTTKRAESMGRITDYMKSQAAEFGIEVIDVRIGRTDLPEDTSQSVYTRMRSSRIAQAAQLRSQGEEKKLIIQAQADKQRTIILAKAQKQFEILKGEGDGARTRILNEAYGRDPDFFDFYLSLETLGKALDEGTTMVLGPDSELFQFLK